MSARVVKWFVLCLLLAAGAWLFWRGPGQRVAVNKNQAAATTTAAAPAAGAAPLTNPALVSAAEAKTNRLAYRLSNTTRPIGRLMKDNRAILLENALIDSGRPVIFSFPKQLQSQGDPGAYIVQARGPVTAVFRATLARAGAQIVAYIPNNAYLVRTPAGVANGLVGNPLTQAVIPYEPYYKISSSMPVMVGQKSLSSVSMGTNRVAGPSLLVFAVKQASLPAGTALTLGLFNDSAAATVTQIEKLGGQVVARDNSPFGPVVRVQPPKDWVALAALPGVQIVEPYYQRQHANDLSRVATGVATNTTAPATANYLNLQGLNVLVAVDDTGIDAEHPDFSVVGSASAPGTVPPSRIFGFTGEDLTDTNGHGTHVAGIIAGNGSQSYTTMSNNVQFVEGSTTNADFRGKAPQATLFSMNLDNSDRTLQEQAALTNALISNNSWTYAGDNAYDLAAASYDAATRDALSQVTGSQPVLFVFAAGNDGFNGANGGNGDDNGAGGTADTITSPATAKNVITVGALEQLRNITNIVTDVNSNQSETWQPGTDTGFQVAGYSSRGNVGIGIEGASGRFKPDVSAPGTFVVSTSSQFNHQWATNAYYNPTNHDTQTLSGQPLDVNGINYYSLLVPQNAIGVTVQIQQNGANPLPTNLLIYVSQFNFPDPTDSTTYDFFTTNQVVIPGDGPANYLNTIQGTGFNFAVVNSNATPVTYNLTTDVATTNDLGNYYSVLEGMNDSLGGYYRYESGTSMAAADVSGTLALIQDFFTNTLHQTPSPALLKAMIINGARPTGVYNLQVNNTINYEGWGLINLPNTLPTNSPANYNGSMASSIYFQDQSPTNTLATGDTHSFTLKVQTNSLAPLRLTLAWTDPPGDPIAAIKLVNGLELVVSNYDNPTNPIVYYGNDIPADSTFNTPQNPTNAPNVDTINNVQSVIIPAPLGTNYTVFVIGREVNVNAVSAQTNNPAGVYAPNVVQDYALVISSGNASAPGSFTITDNGVVSNPTGDQNITIIGTTNTANTLLNQFVGANSPVLNTNFVAFTSNPAYGTAQDSLGLVNQWHFYVVTNTGPKSDFTNAAFVIYSPPTLSVPRMGVFTGANTNATMPQANIDLYATTDPTFTNLNPVVISNCINLFSNGGIVYYNASLGPGGAKFLVDTNSKPGEVYYVGVKSEDQMAAEYSFLSVFTETPFNQMDHGDEIVSALTVPVGIPGGSPSVPGFVDAVAIAVQPINVGWVVVTNEITQVDVGDLVSSLSFNNINVGLMTHTSPNSPGTFDFVYDDSGVVNPLVTPLPPGYILRGSDGPGSLQDFIGQSASSGVWVFHLANSVLPFSGSVNIFSLRIHPQTPLTSGLTNVIPPHTMVFDAVDVPAGATNLTVNATNVTAVADNINPPLMVLKFGSQPTLTNADKGPVALMNPPPFWLGGSAPGLGNSLSVGPTDVPPIQPGRYWVGITNQSDSTQDVFVVAVILPPNPSPSTTDFASTGSTPLLDDAVTYSDIFVQTNMPIVSMNVGIEVQHPRISDLVFHLISPDGTRVLLMENRGDNTANAGAMVTVTNIVATTNTVAVTNSLASSAAGDYSAGFGVAGWNVGANQVSLVNDPLNASPGNNNLLALASGSLSTTLTTVPGQTYSVSFPYRGPGIAGWWRGENNTNDSSGNGNNPSAVQNITFAGGKVGQAFQFDGSTSLITMAPSGSLSVSNVTLEAWVYPTDTSYRPVIESGGSGDASYIGMWVNTTGGNSIVPGAIHAYVRFNPYTTGILEVDCPSSVVQLNQWNHLAFSVNTTTLAGVVYCNGVQVASGTSSPAGHAVNPKSFVPWNIGYRDSGSIEGFGTAGRRFLGNLDEVSIYDRPLSFSEIKAIYNLGTSGKYDPVVFSTSPPLSLAEARVSLTGQATNTLNGLNTSWQPYTATFKAVTNQTTLTVSGVEPGMLLGPLVVTNPVLVTNIVTNTYYLTFTEDTNLTTTPIKFAVPPFVPDTATGTIFTDGFEQTSAGDYNNGTGFGNGWTVTSNQVSVVTDPVNAFEGSNLLALASGVISNTLPTVAGQSYTLTFVYRGPGIAGWWRAENNTNDSINGNNPSAVQNIAITNGEVGKAFYLDGSTSFITLPASASLAVSNLTCESWIYPTTTQFGPIIAYGGPGTTSPVSFWCNGWGLSSVPGLFSGYVRPRNPGIQSASGIVPQNQWSHVAFTFDAVTGTERLYYNGALVATGLTSSGPADTPFVPVGLGYLDSASLEATRGLRFAGRMDETSIYSRALSASEINAIYNKGTAGKFDPGVFSTSPALSLAEAQVSLNGQTQGTLNGNNTNWQVETITFTATQNGTPLQIAGLEPGMLLDAFSLAQTTGNIYYLPEQSLNLFNSKSAFGDWRLEIQDDRAGAGLTNALVSWNLQFVFANTNAIPTVLTGGIGKPDQFIPAGSIAWYQVTVPTNANFATNILLFASAPVNVWFSTNVPPTIVNAGDTNLIPNSTGGSALLSTTNVTSADPNYRQPPNIYPGGTYYLGVQNTNSFTVNYGIQVNFDITFLSAGAPVFLFSPGTNVVDELTPLNVANTAQDPNPALTLTYTLSTVIDTNMMNSLGWPLTYVTTNPPPVIDNSGNITWTPSEAQGPGVYDLTTVVTDNGTPPMSNTNTFTVIVDEVNTAPQFVVPDPPNLTNNALNLLIVTNAATDSDIPPNPLTYALDGAPTNAAIDTNGVITWMPAIGHAGTNYTFATIVTDTNMWAPVNQSLSTTNYFTVTVLPPLSLTSRQPQTNSILSGGLVFYVVNVPTNADFATNLLLFAGAPVNVWFDTNSFPTTNILFLPDLAYPGGTNGTVLLSTTNATTGDPNYRQPPNIYDGQTYYLGVQNTNTFPVTFAVEVDFHLLVITNPPTMTLLSGTGDLRGVGIKYLSSSLYIVGDDTTLGGLLGAYATPLATNSVPQWKTNWPSANPADLLNGVTANSNGVYAAGPNDTRTIDTVGGKEPKGLVVKYPLGGATGSGFGGDIWDVQTPAPPGAFAYGGGEGLNAITLASENGTNFVYATGSSQEDGANGGRLYVSKLAESSSILWTVNDGTGAFGEPYSVGEAVAPLDGFVYAAGVNNGNPYLRKYDQTGNLVWSRTTATNGVYFGICTYANFIFAVGGTGAGAAEDFLVDKWDENGNLLWSRAYDHGSNQDELHGVVNGNGHLFAVGFTLGLTAGGADAVVLEISPAAGDLISTNLFGGTLDDKANGVDTDNTNLFVIGETKSFTPGVNQLMLIEYPLTLPALANVVSGFTATVVPGPAIQLQWAAPTNYQFQLQWATSLTPPIVWNTFTNIVTSTTGTFTFMDNGSQSGGLGGTKFYRLVEYPNP